MDAMGWKYRRGYTGRNYHVTGGHENQAKAAQRAKKPSRLGLLVLRMLGLRAAPNPALPLQPSPSRQHRRRP